MGEPLVGETDHVQLARLVTESPGGSTTASRHGPRPLHRFQYLTVPLNPGQDEVIASALAHHEGPVQAQRVAGGIAGGGL